MKKAVNQPVLDNIIHRRSYRSFLGKEVPEHVISEILETASWSPSSTNMQPWKVTIVSGRLKDRLSEALGSAFDKGQTDESELVTYPDVWEEPYRSRRIECGMKLYEALGIEREDKERRIRQMRENFSGFGAPVLLFLTMDRSLKEGSVFDCGMFFQSLMLAARAYGLETCPQASLIMYPEVLREFLEIPNNQRILSGLAMGYGDDEHPVNNYRTSREEVAEFAVFKQ